MSHWRSSLQLTSKGRLLATSVSSNIKVRSVSSYTRLVGLNLLFYMQAVRWTSTLPAAVKEVSDAK